MEAGRAQRLDFQNTYLKLNVSVAAKVVPVNPSTVLERISECYAWQRQKHYATNQKSDSNLFCNLIEDRPSRGVRSNRKDIRVTPVL